MCIDGDFALVDDRPFVLVYEFNRIFDRDDVTPSPLVNGIDQRSQCRRFTAAGRARNERETADDIGHFQGGHWKVELIEGEYLRLDSAQNQRDGTSLPEYVDTKTPDTLFRKRQVNLAPLVEVSKLGVVQHERVSNMLGIADEKIADLDGDKYKTSTPV